MKWGCLMKSCRNCQSKKVSETVWLCALVKACWLLDSGIEVGSTTWMGCWCSSNTTSQSAFTPNLTRDTFTHLVWFISAAVKAVSQTLVCAGLHKLEITKLNYHWINLLIVNCSGSNPAISTLVYIYPNSLIQLMPAEIFTDGSKSEM